MMVSMTDSALQDGITVGAAANAAGVTVRTLHHWDEIGLASPSGRSAAGYRLYTQDDLDRLDRVIAYRAAGLALDTIRGLLDDLAPGGASTLREQRSLLAARIRELQRLDERLGRIIDAHERGILLTDDEQSEAFGEQWDPQDALTARARWGGNLQWSQFAERSASRSKAQWQRLADDMRKLQRDLADARHRGVEPGTTDADRLAERHRELFSNFFPITIEMQVCLVRMFEEDPGFAAYYNGLAPELASWFRQIVDAAARSRGIDPDAAAWQ